MDECKPLNDGSMDLDEVRHAVRADDQHFPITRALCIEQTHNKAGAYTRLR